MKERVLLVGDYPDILGSLGCALRLEGYDVSTASRGRPTLNSLRKGNLDLVLLDLDIPAGNAWDTVRRMFSNAFSLPAILHFSLPVIIITGRSDQQWLATQKGVAAVFEKPLNLSLVLDEIKRVLAQSAKVRQRRVESGHVFCPPSSAGSRGTVADGSL